MCGLPTLPMIVSSASISSSSGIPTIPCSAWLVSPTWTSRPALAQAHQRAAYELGGAEAAQSDVRAAAGRVLDRLGDRLVCAR